MENVQKLRNEEISGSKVRFVSDDESDHSSISSLGGEESEIIGSNIHRVSWEAESM